MNNICPECNKLFEEHSKMEIMYCHALRELKKE